MNSILIGNGINIQFAGKEYLNGNIIRRAINNVMTGCFSSVDYPQEVMRWVYILHGAFPEILNGGLDNYAYTSFEKESLKDLKKRYHISEEYSVYEIGIEDYFLLHDLFCSKYNVSNPDSYAIREVLKRLFLDAIYNTGKIQKIHKEFPRGFKKFLESHDSIFTTNYDNNIEKVISKGVLHLHGSFDVISETYDIDSFRNQLSDKPAQDFNITEKNQHLYSNAIMSYGGYLKDYATKQYQRANSVIDKFADGYKNNPQLKQLIEEWEGSSNGIIQNLFEGVMLKVENPELRFRDEYPIDELANINGTLRVLGLSPNNDIHLFKSIIENEEIDRIEYYCFDDKEAEIVKGVFRSKNVDILDVKTFWETMN